MDEIRQEIKIHDTQKKWSFLSENWKIKLSQVDAILVKDGIEDDEAIKLKTLAIQDWLFRFEFINSLIAIGPQKIVFLGNPEKIALLKLACEEATKTERELICIEKTDKLDQGEISAFFAELDKLGWKKFGVFPRETQKGPIIDQLAEKLKSGAYEETDVSGAVQEILSVKLAEDIRIIEESSKITNYFFDAFIKQIEGVIDENSRLSHIAISKKMENLLVKSKAYIEKKLKAKAQFFDYAYSPIVQSGSYNLKPNAESDDSPLSHDCILLNMTGKYFGLNCNIFRTLVINPLEGDKSNYKAMFDIHNRVIKAIRVGKVYKDIHSEIIDFVQAKYPTLVDKLPSNFGFGIGYEFKESCLLINKKNVREVKKGNVLTVITSLKNLVGFRNKNYSMHVADTVVVDGNGDVINLTSEIPAGFDDIGYNIEEEPEPANNGHLTMPVEDDTVRKRTRAAKRGQQMAMEHARQEKIKANQKKLIDLKMEELHKKLEEGFFDKTATKTNKILLEKMNSYSPENFPDHVNKKNVYVDNKRYSVLIPIGKQLVPFHVLCIKNATTHSDGKHTLLRINFQTPAISSGNIVFPTVEEFGSTPIYVKELTLRSQNREGINATAKQIKELQKKYKLQFNLASRKVKENERQVLRNRLKTLNELKMRPTMAGKKTVGNLTAFANGFKFVSKRSNVFELMLSNIKHAIFQPCDDNMVIIIHFNLYNPVIINKKLANDVQFYVEVGNVIEDLNDTKGRRRAEFDEYEEEQLEEQERERYNKLFLDFISYTEKNWDSKLKFEKPFMELGFYGSHSSNNVFIVPTANGLVSLIENPFMVVSLNEIEIVSIERVDNIIKNFDIAIIFKDYSKSVLTISNIPKTNLGIIKEWLE